MTPLLAAIAWFANPAPLDMPKAEAYLVTEQSGAMRLEDRFDELDLWTSHAVLGRWTDDDGRVLTIAKTDAAAPRFLGETTTRARYAANVAALKRGDDELRREAAARLSPIDIADEPSRPRQLPRGMKSVEYLHGTNETAIVCSFLPEKSPAWYFAAWTLADGDDFAERLADFEDGFLAEWADIAEERLATESDGFAASDPWRETATRRGAKRGGEAAEAARERDLLRADVRRSVANYEGWRTTEAPEFSIIDDLPSGGTFIASLTNELSAMRRRYAEVVPSPIDGSNVLAVARIFRDRSEYLDALEVNDVEGMEWSAAYWSQRRRELVAYLPEDGAAELLKTIRHEAFHQYLSYAASMASASPWLNEGYAQYFEDEDSPDWGFEIDVDAVADLIPSVLAMDYSAFYDGTDAERRLKYRIAWSLAHFLEKGAPKIRFEPFKDVKRDYMASLLKHHDMRKATAAAFGSTERLAKFVEEWKKFWKNT